MAGSRKNDRPSKRARSQYETSDATGAPDFGVDETATSPQTCHVVESKRWTHLFPFKAHIYVQTPDSTAHPPEQTPFPWWDLPGEIRNTIYDILLVARPSIYFNRSQPARAPETALLLVSLRMYAEASSALYARNVFRFERPRLLHDFLTTLPPRPRAWLRHIQLAAWRRPPFAQGRMYRHRRPTQTMLAFRCLRTRCLRTRCVDMHLARVELTRRGESTGGGRLASLEELARHVLGVRDCREWLRAVGRGRGDGRAGADVLCYSEKVLREQVSAEGDLVGAFRKVLGDLLVWEEFS